MLFEKIAAHICIAGVITFGLSIKADQVCRFASLIDHPGERKRHRAPTPLLGGLALLLACLPVAFVWQLLNPVPEWSTELLIWTAAVACMALVGVADDRHSLLARDRMLMSFLVFLSAAAAAEVFNVRILQFAAPEVRLGLGTGAMAILFTAFCCVGLINAVNMADGKNGLVIGLCLGWTLLIAVDAPLALLPILAILAAALLILLFFNLFGKLFLGDGGALGFATAIALISIAAYNRPDNPTRWLSADEIMLLFYLPITDLFRLMIVRIINGRSPMSADRDHLHHHLLNWFGWPGGLLVYWAAGLGPAALLILCRAQWPSLG